MACVLAAGPKRSLAALPSASDPFLRMSSAPKRRRDQPTTLEEQIADAEIRAILAEDAISIGEDGEPIIKMPWAPVIAKLRRGWPENSEEREDAESVLKWVCRGSYREVAFHRSGLRPGLNTTWQARAAKGDPRYVLLRDLMDQAESIAECQALSLIERASRRDWRAAAWFLERRNPERWGTGALRAPHQHMSTTKDPRFNGQAPAAGLVEHNSAGAAPLLPPLPPSEFDGPGDDASGSFAAAEPVTSNETPAALEKKAAE